MYCVFAQQTLSMVPTSGHTARHPNHPNVVAWLTNSGRSIVLELKYNYSVSNRTIRNIMKCIVFFIQQALKHGASIQTHLVCEYRSQISICLHLIKNNRLQLIFAAHIRLLLRATIIKIILFPHIIVTTPGYNRNE